MRIVLIGAESTGLGEALAAHLNLHHIQRPEEVAADGFVLEGAPRDVTEARALDAVLRGRAADLDAVLVVRGAGPEPVLEHYRGRIVELADAELPDALDALREALLATA